MDVSVDKDRLLAYVPKFFGILAGRWGIAMVREKEKLRKSGSRFGSIPWLRSFFLLIETLPIAGQKFSNCLKNGGDRLRTCTAYSQVRYKLMKEIGRNMTSTSHVITLVIFVT